jgi:hypothetical protein
MHASGVLYPDYMAHIESLDPDTEGGEEARSPHGSEEPEAPGQSEPTEPQIASEPADDPLPGPSGWRRVVGHKAFVPSAMALATLVGAVAVLVTHLPESTLPVLRTFVARRPDLTVGVPEKVADVVKRTSPVEHMVRSYGRSQPCGPGRTERKMVEIASHSRGSRA